MVANDEFFQRQQAAAVLKHGVLRRYSTVFATMAGTRTGRVVYFDAYAGPGRYDDGSPGSPLLAMRAAATTAAWGRQVQCLFSEADRKKAAALSEALAAEAPEGFQYTVWPGDASEHVDGALEVARRDAMLTFLDPFGTALDYTSFTDKLLRRPAHLPTEVLLNLNLEMVSRIGGVLDSGKPQPHDETTLSRLDTFFGDQWWRQVFLDNRGDRGPGSAAAAAQAVASRFVRRVKDATGFGFFGVPVRRRPGHQPLFLLILFTRVGVAPWRFNDAVSQANADWREHCWRQDLDRQLGELSTEPDLFGEWTAQYAQQSEHEAWLGQQKQLEQQWVDALGQNLVQLAHGHGPVRLMGHIKAVYGTTLGLAREKHVRAAWDARAAAGQLAPRDKSVKHLEQAVLSMPQA